jgi:hypothetical protein
MINVWSKLRSCYPRTCLALLLAWILGNINFYSLADVLIDGHTDLRHRNPDFSPDGVKLVLQLVRVVYLIYALHLKVNGTFPMEQSVIDPSIRMGMTLSFLVIVYTFNFHGSIHTRGDRLLLLGVPVSAAVINYAVNIWTMGCYFIGTDLFSVLLVVAEKSNVLALILLAVTSLWSS